MLEGELVRLRALEPPDVERAHAWINDREVKNFTAQRYPLSRAGEETWLREVPTNSFVDGVRLAIETKVGDVIGILSLRETRVEDRKAELAVTIGEKDYWSRGHGTDAIVTALRFAFDEMNLHRVWLTTLEYNDRALACYKKCGFTVEGRLRQEMYKAGRYWDLTVMGVLRDAFEELHGAAKDSQKGGGHATGTAG